MNRIYRISVIIILQALLCAEVCLAIPAKRFFFKVTLEDGTTTMVTKRGDEAYHFLVDKEGTPVIEVSEGIYRLAPEEKENIGRLWSERSKIRNAHRFRKAESVAARNKARKAFGHPSLFTGKKKGVVILVNFSDSKMKAANTREAFEAQFNQVGYSKNSHYGSVHDYFLDQSYGKFDLTFDVFGPVTVSRSYTYYGANDSNGDDKYPAVMVTEACKLVNSKYDINWADYDWDGDGYVDQVFCIYAGVGENASEQASLLWPHESTLEAEQEYGDGNGPVKFNGTSVDTYAISCELRGPGSSTMNGIGTACHEFCHCLGIPDMYDTSYSGGYGMNAWDLMDCGSYNGPSGSGEIPAGFTAYERWFAGWLDFTELKEPCYVRDMPALQDSPVAYIIYNDGNRNEYFILENRQPIGWYKYVDTYSYLSGMLAYHVDYDAKVWESNEVNDKASHPRMSIIPAALDYGTYYSSYGMYSPTLSQMASQLFPGNKDVTTLDNLSHSGKTTRSPYNSANGKLFSRNTDGTFNMNKPVTDITESADGLISFTFMDGGDDTGIAVATEDCQPEYFTLSGMKVDSPKTSGIYLVRRGTRVQRMSVRR